MELTGLAVVGLWRLAGDVWLEKGLELMAEVLRRPELGRIEVGAAADLALFDLEELRFSGTEDPLAALVFSGASRARHVMVAGNWRVSDYDVVGMDLARLRARHDELARTLRSAL